MDLHYASEFETPSPEAYERLLLDIMAGDHTLFIRGKSVELTWQFTQRILDAWRDDHDIPLYEYPAGSWGPQAADELIAGDNRALVRAGLTAPGARRLKSQYSGELSAT